MPRGGPLIMENFALNALDNKKYPNNLRWIDRRSGIFCLTLTHKNNAIWKEEDVRVFVDWDKMKKREAQSKTYLTDSKQRFKNGLIKSISVEKADQATLTALGIKPTKNRLYYKYKPRPKKPTRTKSKKKSSGKSPPTPNNAFESPPTPPTTPETEELQSNFMEVGQVQITSYNLEMDVTGLEETAMDVPLQKEQVVPVPHQIFSGDNDMYGDADDQNNIAIIKDVVLSGNITLLNNAADDIFKNENYETFYSYEDFKLFNMGEMEFMKDEISATESHIS